MDEAGLRVRLAGLPSANHFVPATDSLIAAAVLVPIILAHPPAILLTKRSALLPHHAGQVSFPGGRIEASDASPAAAALREAAEEIALDARRVSLLGRLPDHITSSGFRITPVVGLLPPGLATAPAPAEVDAVFSLPLPILLDPAAPHRRQTIREGRAREHWVWPHPEHDIWGATAAILLRLAQALRGEA